MMLFLYDIWYSFPADKVKTSPIKSDEEVECGTNSSPSESDQSESDEGCASPEFLFSYIGTYVIHVLGILLHVQLFSVRGTLHISVYHKNIHEFTSTQLLIQSTST